MSPTSSFNITDVNSSCSSSSSSSSSSCRVRVDASSTTDHNSNDHESGISDGTSLYEVVSSEGNNDDEFTEVYEEVTVTSNDNDQVFLLQDTITVRNDNGHNNNDGVVSSSEDDDFVFEEITVSSSDDEDGQFGLPTTPTKSSMKTSWGASNVFNNNNNNFNNKKSGQQYHLSPISEGARNSLLDSSDNDNDEEKLVSTNQDGINTNDKASPEMDTSTVLSATTNTTEATSFELQLPKLQVQVSGLSCFMDLQSVTGFNTTPTNNVGYNHCGGGGDTNGKTRQTRQLDNDDDDEDDDEDQIIARTTTSTIHKSLKKESPPRRNGMSMEESSVPWNHQHHPSTALTAPRPSLRSPFSKSSTAARLGSPTMMGPALHEKKKEQEEGFELRLLMQRQISGLSVGLESVNEEEEEEEDDQGVASDEAEQVTTTRNHHHYNHRTTRTTMKKMTPKKLSPPRRNGMNMGETTKAPWNHPRSSPRSPMIRPTNSRRGSPMGQLHHQQQQYQKEEGFELRLLMQRQISGLSLGLESVNEEEEEEDQAVASDEIDQVNRNHYHHHHHQDNHFKTSFHSPRAALVSNNGRTELGIGTTKKRLSTIDEAVIHHSSAHGSTTASSPLPSLPSSFSGTFKMATTNNATTIDDIKRSHRRQRRMTIEASLDRFDPQMTDTELKSAPRLLADDEPIQSLPPKTPASAPPVTSFNDSSGMTSKEASSNPPCEGGFNLVLRPMMRQPSALTFSPFDLDDDDEDVDVDDDVESVTGKENTANNTTNNKNIIVSPKPMTNTIETKISTNVESSNYTNPKIQTLAPSTSKTSKSKKDRKTNKKNKKSSAEIRPLLPSSGTLSRLPLVTSKRKTKRASTGSALTMEDVGNHSSTTDTKASLSIARDGFSKSRKGRSKSPSSRLQEGKRESSQKSSRSRRHCSCSDSSRTRTKPSASPTMTARRTRSQSPSSSHRKRHSIAARSLSPPRTPVPASKSMENKGSRHRKSSSSKSTESKKKKKTANPFLIVPLAKHKDSRQLRSQQTKDTFPSGRSLSLADHPKSTRSTIVRKRSSRKSNSKSTKRSSKLAESSSIVSDFQNDPSLDRHSCHEIPMVEVKAKVKHTSKKKARPQRDSKVDVAKLKSGTTTSGKRSSCPPLFVSSKYMDGWRKVVPNARTRF